MAASSKAEQLTAIYPSDAAGSATRLETAQNRRGVVLCICRFMFVMKLTDCQFQPTAGPTRCIVAATPGTGCAARRRAPWGRDAPRPSPVRGAPPAARRRARGRRPQRDPPAAAPQRPRPPPTSRLPRRDGNLTLQVHSSAALFGPGSCRLWRAGTVSPAATSATPLTRLQELISAGGKNPNGSDTRSA